MTKWVAQGSFVFAVADDELGDLICEAGDFIPDEAAHRMAQQIADEHNRLQEVERLYDLAYRAIKHIGRVIAECEQPEFDDNAKFGRIKWEIDYFYNVLEEKEKEQQP